MIYVKVDEKVFLKYRLALGADYVFVENNIIIIPQKCDMNLILVDTTFNTEVVMSVGDVIEYYSSHMIVNVMFYAGQVRIAKLNCFCVGLTDFFIEQSFHLPSNSNTYEYHILKSLDDSFRLCFGHKEICGFYPSGVMKMSIVELSSDGNRILLIVGDTSLLLFDRGNLIVNKDIDGIPFEKLGVLVEKLCTIKSL